MRSITRSGSYRGTLLRLVMLVALLVVTAPGGLVASPQTAENGNAVLGPVFPPPGVANFGWSGAGETGRPGGFTLTFTGFDPTELDTLYWGSSSLELPGITLDGAIDDEGETLVFNEAESDLTAGVLVFSGVADVHTSTGTLTLPTRLTITVEGADSALGLLAASEAELPAAIGGVATVHHWNTTVPEFQVHLLAEAFHEGDWHPVLDLYDSLSTIGTNEVEIFFMGGFYYVASINTPPVAVANAYQVLEGTALSVAAPGVLGNDTDADTDPLTAHLVQNVSSGTLALNANGGFIYTPAAGFVGVDTFTYRAYDGEAYSNTVTVSITVNDAPVVPIEGSNRYTTAVEASIRAYPTGLAPAGARTVVIATGENWPDALGGSSLAGALDGPVLLTRAGSISTAVTAEIDRLGATKAIILGGTAAVSGDVEAALKTLLGNTAVERIAGNDRYKTADAVAKRVISVKGGSYDGKAFVATGGNFPDALAAAPLAAAKHWPLYLAHPTRGITAGTQAAMAGVTEVLVLGGTAVVPQPVEDYLKTTYGNSKVRRLAGANRFATAVVVATYGVQNAGLGWDRVGIATGDNFPDALAGGVLQGKQGSVMLLTRSTALSTPTRDALAANKAAIDSVTFFGGTSAVSEAVRTAVANALE